MIDWMKWMIFIKLLKNTAQKKHEILIFFDDLIDEILSNKKT